MATAQSSAPPIYDALRTLLTHAAGSALHPSDKAVHAMRRDAKRIRAALRLLRGRLDETSYNYSNIRVRDAGRALAAARDAAVLLRSARRLPAGQYTAVEQRYVSALLPQLDLERRSVKRRLTAAVMSRRATLLSEVQQHLDSRPAPSCDLTDMAEGIRRAYKAARKAWRRAQHRPNDQRLHAWRKRVKYLTDQLHLVQEAFQIDYGKLHRHALHLGHHLGKHHDLAILTAKMDAVHLHNGLAADDEGRRRLKRRLRHERKRLQRKAWRRGEKLLFRSPREFARHLWGHSSSSATSDTL